MVKRPPKPEGIKASPRFRMRKEEKMPNPPRTQPMSELDWLDILNEMDKGDHRTAAVVAASFLENNLATAIMARLKELSDAEVKDLFEEDRAALSTFSAKTDIAFALNLFDADVKHDIDAIRHVRNLFAHRLDVRDFDHEEVAQYCDGLRGPSYFVWAETKGRKPEKARRERYLSTASHLIARFDMESKHIYRPPQAAVRTYETQPKPPPGQRGAPTSG